MRAMDFLAPSCLASRHDVVVLLVVDGDEEVALAHRGLAQHGKGGRVALDRNDVGQAAHVGQQLLVGVDDGDVVAVSAQHLGQMAPHLAGSRNDDSHRFDFWPDAAPATLRPAFSGRSSEQGGIFAN